MQPCDHALPRIVCVSPGAVLGAGDGEFAELVLGNWHGRGVHLVDTWQGPQSSVEVRDLTSCCSLVWVSFIARPNAPQRQPCLCVLLVVFPMFRVVCHPLQAVVTRLAKFSGRFQVHKGASADVATVSQLQ
jgi:hypothetical protein